MTSPRIANKAQRYSNHYVTLKKLNDDYAKARDALYNDFDEGFKLAALEKLDVARAIVRKATRKRDSGPVPANLKWAAVGNFKDLKLTSFNRTALTFRYTSYFNETETIIFPIEWLSMSTWDFAKMIRQELADEKRKQSERSLAEKQKQAEELALAVKTNLEKLQQINQELAEMKGCSL